MNRPLAFAFAALVMVSPFLFVPISGAAQLYLTKGHVYKLAAFTEVERAGLLEEIKKTNPDLHLTNLTKEGSSVKLHIGSGDYMEIQSNELYSLAVYVPPGIEADISRRSGTAFKVGRIVRENEGVRFYFGSPMQVKNRGLAGILSTSVNEKNLLVPTVKTKTQPSPLHLADPPGVQERDQRIQSPEARMVESVDLSRKPAADPRIRSRASLSTIRFKERIKKANQPRIEPLSERISDVGVPPPTSRKRKPKMQDRELAVAKLSGEVPVLDGYDDDNAWSAVRRMSFSVAGAGVIIEVAAATDGIRLFLLFSWPENGPSHRHRPWTWNENDGRYHRQDLLDDGVAIRWQMDKTAGEGRQEFDLWLWRAGREGFGSHASDAKLLVDDKPFYMASRVQSKNSGLWTRLDFDRGRLPFEIVLPSSFSGPEVASYVPSRPEGSASDVRGVGAWAEGKWVVEMSRLLRTEYMDDIPFDKEGKYAFIVNLLQGKDLIESPASEVLTLRW